MYKHLKVLTEHKIPFSPSYFAFSANIILEYGWWFKRCSAPFALVDSFCHQDHGELWKLLCSLL